MTKLAQGRLDLHSRRGGVDLNDLAERVAAGGGAAELAGQIATANSAMHAFQLAETAGFDLPRFVAEAAWRVAARAFAGGDCALEIILIARDGRVVAATGFAPV
jgi:cobalt-precorrin-5B (C1)-methyltransferase